MVPRVLIAFLLALLAGCSKPGSSAPDTPEPAAQTTDSGGTSATQVAEPGTTVAGATAGSEAELAAALSQLTQVLRKYAVEKQRVPKSLEELVQQGYLQSIPQAPAGQVFAIDKQLQVYLDKR